MHALIISSRSLSIPGILSSDLLAHLDRFISNPKYKSVAGDTVMFYNSICLFVEEHTGKGSRLISHSPKSPLINSRNNQRRKVHSYKTTHINSPIQSSQRLTESSLKLLGSPRNKKSGMNSPWMLFHHSLPHQKINLRYRSFWLCLEIVLFKLNTSFGVNKNKISNTPKIKNFNKILVSLFHSPKF